MFDVVGSVVHDTGEEDDNVSYQLSNSARLCKESCVSPIWSTIKYVYSKQALQHPMSLRVRLIPRSVRIIMEYVSQVSASEGNKKRLVAAKHQDAQSNLLNSQKDP